MASRRVTVGSVWRFSFDRLGLYDYMVCGVEPGVGLVVVQSASGHVRYASVAGLTTYSERIA